MRSEDIRQKYLECKVFKDPETDEKFMIGDQMRYEWEQDYDVIKWAIHYLTEYFEIGNPSRNHNVRMALKTLEKRALEYSCASTLKDEHKHKCNINFCCKKELTSNAP